MKQKARTEYGLRLFTARKHAGLTQTALAEKVGMSQSALQEAENTGLKSTYTAQLAAACRVNPQWLATGEGSMTGDTPEPRPEVEQLAEAINLFTKALLNADEFNRDFVIHRLSKVGLDSTESVNLSQKIAELLVKKSAPSVESHAPPRSAGTVVSGSSIDALGGKDEQRNPDAAQGGRKGG